MDGESKKSGRPPKEKGYTRHLVSARLSRVSWHNAVHCAERSGLSLAQVVDVLLAQAPHHPAFAAFFEETQPEATAPPDSTERARYRELLTRFQALQRTHALAMGALAGQLAADAECGMTRWDRELRHLFVNGAAAAALGRTVEAVQGKTYAELGVASPAIAFFEAHVRQVIRSRQAALVDFADPLGAPRTLRLYLLPEFTPDGEVDAVLGVTFSQNLSGA